MKIILNAGGTEQQTVSSNDIKIPDLWHIAEKLPVAERDKVLSVWYLAHDLLGSINKVTP